MLNGARPFATDEAYPNPVVTENACLWTAMNYMYLYPEDE